VVNLSLTGLKAEEREGSNDRKETSLLSVCVPADELLSSQEKPPVGSKDVLISVSPAKDSDSDSCLSKTTSNQSSPLIIRGKGEGRIQLIQL